MAKQGAPQIEDGYTRLANETLEALAKTRFTNSERRLLDAVFRLTYGIYGRRKAEIQLSVLVAMTELTKSVLCRSRKCLIDRGVLTVSRAANKTNLTYQFNKYYKKWKPFAPASKIVRGVKDVDAGANDVDAGVNRTFIKENNNKTKRKDNEPEKKPAPAPPPYQRIIEFLNAMTGSSFDHQAKETRAAIRARFKTGYTEQDFKDVITIKSDQWLGEPKMISYLRPGTLFRPTKFEGYLQEAKRSKKLVTSERQRIKERKFKIASGILRESGQQAALKYCMDNHIDAEEFKQWKLQNIES